MMRHVCGSCRSVYVVRPADERIVQCYSQCPPCELAAVERDRNRASDDPEQAMIEAILAEFNGPAK
jgi:hypothetical protein